MSQDMGKARTHIDAEAVLSGRARARIEDVFALIHTVNPTDRAVAPGEAARRYALKARLQSWLIRHHAEVLTLTVEANGTVAIAHAHGTRDACHAPLAALDDDARRVVEERQILGAPRQRPVPAAASAKTRPAPPVPDGDLARGQSLLEAYDYDGARAAFETAAAQDAGGVSALVELLVDHLADDQAALEVGARFSPQDAPTCGRLAAAAVRLGDVAAARRWLRDAPEAADAWSALARLALTTADLALAEDTTHRLRDLDAAHPDLLDLGQGIIALRERARAPAEAELERAHATGDPDAADTMARELLRRWPDSAVAARVIRAVAEARRARRVAALTTRALALDDAVAVRELLGVLRAEDAPALNEGAVVAHLARVQLAAVLAAWDAGARESAWRAYLGLDAERREQVRLLRPDPGWKRVDACGDVALTERVFQADRATGAAEVLRVLEPVAVKLGALPDAADRLARARVEVDDSRRATSRLHLDGVVQLLAAGRGDEAGARLGHGDVHPSHAAEARALRLRIERLGAEASLRAQLESLLSEGDALGARDVARRMLTLSSDPEPLHLAEAEVARQWASEVLDEPSVGLVDYLVDETRPQAKAWLTPDGKTLALVTALARTVVVRLVDPDTLAIQRVLSVRVPTPLRLADVQVDAERIWIAGLSAEVLELGLDGTVHRWRPSPPRLLDGMDRVELACFAPGARYLWVVMVGRSVEGRVFDLAAWPRYVTVPGTCFPQAVFGLAGPDMVWIDLKRTARIATAAGKLDPRRGYAPDHRVLRMAVHPTGGPISGLMALDHVPPHAAAQLAAAGAGIVAAPDPVGVLFMNGPDADGAFITCVSASSRNPADLATSLDQARTYALVTAGGGAVIQAFEMDPTGQLIDHSVMDIHIPAQGILVTDVHSRRVRALAVGPDGPQPVPLDTARWGLDRISAQHQNYRVVIGMAGLTGNLQCPVGVGHPSPTAQALIQVLGPRTIQAREEWLRAYETANAEDPLARLDGILACGDDNALRPLEQEMHSRLNGDFPNHPLTCTIAASGDLGSGDWKAARETLTGTTDEPMPAPYAQHLHHIRCVIALREGDLEGAQAALKLAEAVQGGVCHLDAARTLLMLHAGAPRPAMPAHDNLSYYLSRWGEVWDAIKAADGALADGEPERAIQTLDVPVVWRARELQSAARRAEAWLAVPVPTGAARIRRRLGLGAFQALAVGAAAGRDHELPLGPRAWDEERLAELIIRVHAAVAGTGF